MISLEQKCRYERHILMPEIGEELQSKLLQSSVLIIGAGGLGAPIAYYLTAAGVGHIGIIDSDNVELSNLQRQIIHNVNDLGRPKVESAKEKLQLLNPETEITAINDTFNSSNAAQILAPFNFIIDATDNFDSKFLINDECIKTNKAFSIGSIFRFQGQVLTHTPGSACYRCIFESVPDGNTPIGPISPIPGIIGSIQATEAIKYLIGSDSLLVNTLLTIDALSMEFSKIQLSPRINCICTHNTAKCNKTP